MMNSNKIFFFFNIVIVVLVVIVGVALAWTNPTGNPPSGGGVLYYSGGNVGVGTTTPTEKLDIEGNIKISGTIRGASYGFGGMYAINDYSNCYSVNPFTGDCSCPSGFTDWSNSVPVLDNQSRWQYIHICYK